MRYYDLVSSETMDAIVTALNAHAAPEADRIEPVAFDKILIAKLSQRIAIRAARESMPYEHISDSDPSSNRSDCGADIWVKGWRVGVEVKNHPEIREHFANVHLRVAISFYGLGRLLPFRSAIMMLAEPGGPERVRVVGRIHSWRGQALDRVEGEQDLWDKLKSTRPRRAA